MNIPTHTNVEIAPIACIPEIFSAQRQLALKFGDIERKNGTWKPNFNHLSPPPDIEDRSMQRWVKDMFWRITEELSEATELPVNLAGEWGRHLPEDKALTHFLDEISDALHFLAEVSLGLGINPDDVTAKFWHIDELSRDPLTKETSKMQREFPDQCMSTLGMKAWRVTQAMGLAANLLKNRPWKTKTQGVDGELFHRRVMSIWARFAELCVFIELDLPNLHAIYFEKAKVNEKRIDTGA